MWELEHLDISDFNPRKHYHSAALEDQIRESFNPLERFVCQMLETGEVPGTPGLAPKTIDPWKMITTSTGEQRMPVRCDDLFTDYQRFEKQFSKFPIDSRAFGKRIKKLVPGVKRKRHKVGEARFMSTSSPISRHAAPRLRRKMPSSSTNLTPMMGNRRHPCPISVPYVACLVVYHPKLKNVLKSMPCPMWLMFHMFFVPLRRRKILMNGSMPSFIFGFG